VGGLPAWSGLRQCHNPLDDLRRQRRDARWPSLVAEQPIDAFSHEAFLPAPDSRLGLVGEPHDLNGAAAIRREQHDPGTPNVFLRTVAVGRYGLEPEVVNGAEFDDNAGAHGRDSHDRTRQGIRNRTPLSGFIH